MARSAASAAPLPITRCSLAGSNLSPSTSPPSGTSQSSRRNDATCSSPQPRPMPMAVASAQPSRAHSSSSSTACRATRGGGAWTWPPATPPPGKRGGRHPLSRPPQAVRLAPHEGEHFGRALRPAHEQLRAAARAVGQAAVGGALLRSGEEPEPDALPAQVEGLAQLGRLREQRLRHEQRRLCVRTAREHAIAPHGGAQPARSVNRRLGDAAAASVRAATTPAPRPALSAGCGGRPRRLQQRRLQIGELKAGIEVGDPRAPHTRAARAARAFPRCNHYRGVRRQML